MKSWYNLAYKTALKSNHEKHRMGAVIVQGGRVISHSPNGHSRRWGLEKFSRHAEARALSRLECLEGATIIVARVNGLMSRPCPACLKLIKKAGISKIVFADWNGDICCEKV